MLRIQKNNWGWYASFYDETMSMKYRYFSRSGWGASMGGSYFSSEQECKNALLENASPCLKFSDMKNGERFTCGLSRYQKIPEIIWTDGVVCNALHLDDRRIYRINPDEKVEL